MAVLGTYAVVCIILFVIGLALLVVEMFTPGFGVAGSLGIVAFIVVIVLQFVGNTRTAAWLVTAILLIITIGLLYWMVHSFQYGKLSRSKLILQDAVRENAAPAVETALLGVGTRGVATTPLRPSGIAAFGERRETVNSNGEFIEAGREVEILSVSGLNIVVKKI
ncbi:MAG: hypothetical protein FWF10_02235 [Clostridiales bacterium]|nr:hypothetical protein [Clostridiales bacterium]